MIPEFLIREDGALRNTRAPLAAVEPARPAGSRRVRRSATIADTRAVLRRLRCQLHHNGIGMLAVDPDG